MSVIKRNWCGQEVWPSADRHLQTGACLISHVVSCAPFLGSFASHVLAHSVLLFRLPMQYTVVLAPDLPCRSGECFRRSGHPSLSSIGRGNLCCQHLFFVVLWLTWELFWKSEAVRFTGDSTFFLRIQLSLRTHGLFSHWTNFCGSHIVCCLHYECVAGTSRHHAKSFFQHCTNLSGGKNGGEASVWCSACS